jgi:hypothetical protein
VQTDACAFGGVIDMLHLRRMPTEADVAPATVSSCRAISGDLPAFRRLQQRRTNTERELSRGAGSRCPGQLAGGTVWLFGEHLAAPCDRSPAAPDEARVGHIVR